MAARANWAIAIAPALALLGTSTSAKPQRYFIGITGNQCYEITPFDAKEAPFTYSLASSQPWFDDQQAELYDLILQTSQNTPNNYSGGTGLFFGNKNNFDNTGPQKQVYAYQTANNKQVIETRGFGFDQEINRGYWAMNNGPCPTPDEPIGPNPSPNQKPEPLLPDNPGDIIAEIDDPEVKKEVIAVINAGRNNLGNASRSALNDQLARVASALTLPRNVMAAGGLATQAYVNDLANTLLLQASLNRQPEESNSDNTSPTRAWASAFSGSISPFKTGGAYGPNGVFYPDVYNNFYSIHTGLLAGVSTGVSKTLELGLFGNYGNINLQQFAGVNSGGGSWQPQGFGGGVLANYRGKGLVIQGAVGATNFTGTNKRQVLIPGVINTTYSASKTTTSLMGALRVGTPMRWGQLLLEPHATAIWNGNNDASYAESGRYRAFALKLLNYSDQFLQTSLGAQLAWPLKQGPQKQLMPSLNLAWLADWDTGNGSVPFQRAHPDRHPARIGRIPSNQATEYGALVEAGLDYSLSDGKKAGSGWTLYARGGAKLWFSKLPDWRTSGGLTYRF